MLKKAVFLDRDGVLNEVIIKQNKPYPPRFRTELQIRQGVKQGLKQLKQAGFLLIVVTNQPDVARQTLSKAIVDEINQYLFSILKLDDIRVCLHDDIDDCYCRKPKPGLLQTAADDFCIDLTKSFMIGDRWKDIEAGNNAGCRTIWMQADYIEKKPMTMDYVAKDFLDATNWIINDIR